MEIEVSLKVRSAIKAKLLELGVHVDDELPDYIMVLVANRRSRAQMESDLELFLSENTQKFTTWLFHVLKKLEQVTLTDSIAVVTSRPNRTTEQEESTAKTKPEKEKSANSDEAKAPEKSRAKEPGKSSGKLSNQSDPTSLQKPAAKGTEKAVTKAVQKSHHKAEGKGEPKKADKSKSLKSEATSKNSEKGNDTKVQFKLKNNLVQKTEFDRKNQKAERNTEKTITATVSDDTKVSKMAVNPSAASTTEQTVADDVLTLGEDEGGDLFSIGGNSEDTAKNSTTNSFPDDDDEEKLRKIALGTTPNRQKLRTGNIRALHGILVSNEKENSNKRKRQNEEPTKREPQSRSHTSNSTSGDSPPKKLRSVVSVQPPKRLSEEYDPEQPNIHKLSSVVCVTGNQRPKRNTANMNTNLIFKAMKEVEIDNIKNPTRKQDDESRRRRDSRSGERVRSKTSRSRSRDKDNSRKDSARERDRDRSHRRHEKDRKDSTSGRKHSRHREKSRSPLQLFTRRGRMSIKDRLGEKRISTDIPKIDAMEIEEIEARAYEEEIREMEKDLNIIIKVPNNNMLVESSDDGNTAGKDKQSEESKSAPTPDPQLQKSSQASTENTLTKGYVAPNRISIQVMNSSDESEDSYDEEETEAKREGNTDDDETLEVTVNEERDIDDLLPPQQQPEESSQEKKTPEIEGTTSKQDRLTDLRAKLAAITRSNAASASYSPLHLQPLPRQQAPTATVVKPSAVPYFTPSYFDSYPVAVPDLNYASTGGVTCKFWPTCSYGENCKYTHPRCKYGDSCTKRPNCAFKHDTTFSNAPPFKKQLKKHLAPVASTTSKKPCLFFPKCHSVECSFFHPKPCRYGINCSDPNCIHYHPGIPVGEKKGTKLPAQHQLKWIRTKTDAPVTQATTATIT